MDSVPLCVLFPVVKGHSWTELYFEADHGMAMTTLVLFCFSLILSCLTVFLSLSLPPSLSLSLSLSLFLNVLPARTLYLPLPLSLSPLFPFSLLLCATQHNTVQYNNMKRKEKNTHTHNNLCPKRKETKSQPGHVHAFLTRHWS